MKKIFFTLAIVIIANVISMAEAAAQIKYVDGGLLIGNVTTPHYMYDITANIKGMFIYNSTNYFQLDVMDSTPRLSGQSGKVAFYDTMTSSFNDIQVRQVYYYSDARAKTNVMNFKSGIDVISRLRPVSYNFSDSPKRSVHSNQYTGSNVEIGLLAQELEEVLPNLVFTDSDGKKLVDYTSLIPVLIDAVQTLQQEIEILKEKSCLK